MLHDPDEFQEFLDDITENGFHIFSREKADRNFYPPPPYSSPHAVKIATIKEDDFLTIRAFFPVSKSDPPQIEGGIIDLESGVIFALILTELPSQFALTQGATIEIFSDEILSVR